MLFADASQCKLARVSLFVRYKNVGLAMFGSLPRHFRPYFVATLAAIAMSLACVSASLADDAGPPTLAFWSDNGRFVLRVDQATAKLTLLRSPGKGKLGAEAVVWKVASPLKDGSHLPATAFVRDDGRFVVLCNQYIRLGYGTVLAFLDSTGAARKIYTLKDLFSESEILQILPSVSSI